MKTIRAGLGAAFMTALVAVVALVLGGVPAAAAKGAWAVTYLDPPPSRFAGGTSYALGFWVLQHGTHPFGGQLGPVGLRLTGEGGKSLLFNGTALPEAGHYVTSMVVPEGVWKVEGMQGMFQPHVVGTLTVPGALKVDPLRPELVAEIKASEQTYWGAVRPPGFPPGAAAATASPPGAVAQGLGQAQSGSEAGTGVDAGTETGTGVDAGVGAALEGAGKAGNVVGGDGQGVGGIPAYALLLAAFGGALLAVAALRLPVLARQRILPELRALREPQALPGLPVLARVSRLVRPSRRREDEPEPPPDSVADSAPDSVADSTAHSATGPVRDSAEDSVTGTAAGTVTGTASGPVTETIVISGR
ncbi:hypothetical protein GCM10022419_102620 [Nonomuraea rosea]|uniref:Htaa domain-containing protein n=1 Tax=Nonomuraea rosea TaxID=638574 RepID=A0ABP6ZCQ8_9ACTN